MTSVPGVDHPEEQGEADVTLAARGISVSTRVEFVSDGVLTVRPSVGEFVDQAVVVPGDSVEVYWKAEETRRALTAEVLEDGELRTRAEVVRARGRGARWLLSIRFVGIQEKDQDRVRRRVFQALREERARSME